MWEHDDLFFSDCYSSDASDGLTLHLNSAGVNGRDQWRINSAKVGGVSV